MKSPERPLFQKNIFSQELNDKFNDLQVAITAEENRLQELYGVGHELQKMAVIIESQNERELRFNADIAEKEAVAKQRLDDLQSEYTAKNSELQAEYDIYSKKLKLDRTREAEEYQYNLTRSREKENNAWEDEKTSRKAALKKMEEIASDLLLERKTKGIISSALNTRSTKFRL